MIGALLGPIASLASTWMEGKNEKIKAEMQTKWKDEFWTLVIGGILICSFLPWTQDSIKTGFEFLETSTPDWFTHIILISVSASYGIRVGKGAYGVLQKKMEKQNAKR